MKKYLEERVLEVGNYILENKPTIRETAKIFSLSKSTIALDIKRLKTVNKNLYKLVRVVVDNNKSERSLRGGMATKAVYERRREGDAD